MSDAPLFRRLKTPSAAGLTLAAAPSTSTPVSGDHDQYTDDYSSFDAGFDQHHVNLKLHRVNLLEEMICQFKDESILKYLCLSLLSLMKGSQMQMVCPEIPVLLFGWSF